MSTQAAQPRLDHHALTRAQVRAGPRTRAQSVAPLVSFVSPPLPLPARSDRANLETYVCLFLHRSGRRRDYSGEAGVSGKLAFAFFGVVIALC